MNLYFVRHTEPLIEAGVCYGQLDCALDDSYQAQFEKIRDYFADKPIDAVHSSPLLRCAQLAEDLAHQHPVEKVNYHDDFKEINFGDWEGVAWDDIGMSEIDKWNRDRLHFKFPNGESPSLFMQRVLREYATLVVNTSPSKDCIVIIAHAGVIRTILAKVLSLSFSEQINLALDKASISLVTIEGEQQHLSFSNLRL